MFKSMERVVVDEDGDRSLAGQVMDRMLDGMMNQLGRQRAELRTEANLAQSCRFCIQWIVRTCGGPGVIPLARL